MNDSVLILAEAVAALDRIVDSFVEIILIHRHAGKDERWLAELFEASVSPKSFPLPDDIASEIKKLAYQKLDVRLNEMLSRLVQPENPASH